MKIDTVAKTLSGALNRLDAFNDEVNNVYANDSKKDKSKKQRKAVNELSIIKGIATKLETYESKSRETDAPCGKHRRPAGGRQRNLQNSGKLLHRIDIGSVKGITLTHFIE